MAAATQNAMQHAPARRWSRRRQLLLIERGQTTPQARVFRAHQQAEAHAVADLQVGQVLAELRLLQVVDLLPLWCGVVWCGVVVKRGNDGDVRWSDYTPLADKEGLRPWRRTHGCCARSTQHAPPSPLLLLHAAAAGVRNAAAAAAAAAAGTTTAGHCPAARPG